MSERIFCYYDKKEFNRLWNCIKYYSEEESLKKILEKIQTYCSIENPDEDDKEGEKLIKIGWFDNEIRDVFQILLLNISPIFREKENFEMAFEKDGLKYEDCFSKLVKQKEEQLADPNSYIKYRIRHFSPEATFLSREEEKLLDKSRAILKCLGEITSNLTLGPADFPSRCWVIERIQKTKTTSYDIQEIASGWKIIKQVQFRKDNLSQTEEYTLNNQTLETTKRILEPSPENIPETDLEPAEISARVR